MFYREKEKQRVISNLLTNYEEAGCHCAFRHWLYDAVFHRNLIKKLVGMNIMDTGNFPFLASMGHIEGRKAPIAADGAAKLEEYINPVPPATLS